jgi:hypothetical protein
MKQRKLFPILLAALMCAATAQLYGQDQPAQTDVLAVWQLEEAYWEYVKANDLEGYRTLWDERFVGWPGFSDSPVGKAEIADWIVPLHANPTERYDYELTRKAVKAFGDVVVAHYLVRDFFRDAVSGEVIRELDTYRITHTWQRRSNTWQIITGMSSAQAGK